MRKEYDFTDAKRAREVPHLARLHKRLRPDRPMIPVTMRMPEDVIEDLKRLAPLKGFVGYQGLIRAYIGQGLRVDLEAHENPSPQFIESLKHQGVSAKVIAQALAQLGT